jgi:ketosteroid isomerase-like protein
MPEDRLKVVRDCYRAYEIGDRSLIEPHLSDDFTFYSPPDPGIDLATYWERCWPNAERVAAFAFTRMIEHGDEVVVTYESTELDGSSFCNAEVMTFTGDQVSRVEVYFGWNLE